MKVLAPVLFFVIWALQQVAAGRQKAAAKAPRAPKAQKPRQDAAEALRRQIETYLGGDGATRRSDKPDERGAPNRNPSAAIAGACARSPTADPARRRAAGRSRRRGRRTKRKKSQAPSQSQSQAPTLGARYRRHRSERRCRQQRSPRTWKTSSPTKWGICAAPRSASRRPPKSQSSRRPRDWLSQSGSSTLFAIRANCATQSFSPPFSNVPAINSMSLPSNPTPARCVLPDCSSPAALSGCRSDGTAARGSSPRSDRRSSWNSNSRRFRLRLPAVRPNSICCERRRTTLGWRSLPDRPSDR